VRRPPGSADCMYINRLARSKCSSSEVMCCNRGFQKFIAGVCETDPLLAVMEEFFPEKKGVEFAVTDMGKNVVPLFSHRRLALQGAQQVLPRHRCHQACDHVVVS